MKKVQSGILMLALILASSAAYAGTVANGEEASENANRGAQHVSWSGSEVMQHSGIEASKGKNAAEHVTGAFAGGVIGVREGIHRIGAGAIDLLTFWIPKKQSLIDSNDPVLR
jgi:hypothetical protein